MTKKELLQDNIFRYACNKYNMNCNECTVYGDLILLKNKEKNIYVLLDKNYNIVAIECAVVSNEEEFVNSLYYEYCNYGNYKQSEYSLGYPFDKLYLKQIVDVAGRINIIDYPNSNTLKFKVNGMNCIYKKRDDYSRLLVYIKFLGKAIKNYQLYIFINKEMGIGVADVNVYIHRLIAKINNFIDIHVKNKKVPKVDELIEYLSENDIEYEEYKILLNEIINLLLKQKGYIVEDNKLIESPVSNMSNLSEKAYQLLEILNLSDSEFNMRRKNEIETEEQDLFSIIILGEKHFPTILTKKRKLFKYK